MEAALIPFVAEAQALPRPASNDEQQQEPGKPIPKECRVRRRQPPGSIVKQAVNGPKREESEDRDGSGEGAAFDPAEYETQKRPENASSEYDQTERRPQIFKGDQSRVQRVKRKYGVCAEKYRMKRPNPLQSGLLRSKYRVRSLPATLSERTVVNVSPIAASNPALV